MTWYRKDDQMPIHRKVAPLSDGAYRLYDEALAWCSRNTTDGVIAANELTDISKRGKPRMVRELVDHDLWHPAGYHCPHEKTCAQPGPNGWVIHDYLAYNPSKEKVERDREAKSKRQRRWIEARTGGDASQDASRDASRDATPGDASIDATPSRPVPSRPEGRRDRDGPAATAAAAKAATTGGDGRKCPRHRGQPAHNCGLCRAEHLAERGQP